jgi:hypothetical protein
MEVCRELLRLVNSTFHSYVLGLLCSLRSKTSSVSEEEKAKDGRQGGESR